jgi:plastocyanin
MTKIVTALFIAVIGWGCGDEPAPPPQPESPAQEGVFGRAPVTAQGLPSVVTLRPDAPATAPLTEEPVVLDQLGLAFLPKQLLVRVGQPLVFTNSETLAHNVHVTYIDNDSTVYLTDMGPSERGQIVLDLAGGYDVTCDVHPGMRAFIFVTSAPYAAFADADGNFLIADVPPGSYTASVWSAAPASRGERSIQVSGPSTELDLTAIP